MGKWNRSDLNRHTMEFSDIKTKPRVIPWEGYFNVIAIHVLALIAIGHNDKKVVKMTMYSTDDLDLWKYKYKNKMHCNTASY